MFSGVSSQGSAQRRSHIGPLVGGSLNRSIFAISLSFLMSGLIPPCTHKNLLFKSAAKGRQSNVDMKRLYTYTHIF